MSTVNSDSIESYLECESSTKRIEILKSFSSNNIKIPFSYVKDLLYCDLYHIEHSFLLKLCDFSNNDEFEYFITEGYFNWDQNVVSTAISTWSLSTENNFSPMNVLLSQNRDISQRISYTLLDCAWYSDGHRIIENLCKQDDLENMSSTFLGMLIVRSIQWNFKNDRILKICQELFHKVSSGGLGPDNSHIFPALTYLALFDDCLVDFGPNNRISEIVSNYLSYLNISSNPKSIAAKKELIEKAVDSQKLSSELFYIWNDYFLKSSLNSKEIINAYKLFNKNNLKNPINWKFFSGIKTNVLESSFKLLSFEEKPNFIETVGSLIPNNNIYNLIKNEKINSHNSLLKRYSKLEFIEIPKNYQKFLLNITKITNFSSDSSRSIFINTAYKNCSILNKKIETTDNEGIWKLLLKNWLNPDEKDLDKLSEHARKTPKIFHLFYIDALGKFRNSDQAVLKLLDYVRNKDLDILRKVIHSLHAIGTSRSFQEMISFLTRSNVDFSIQMEIVQLFQNSDLSLLQRELRSALNDLSIDSKYKHRKWELEEALSSLLYAADESTNKKEIISDALVERETTTEKLDELLSQKISIYEKVPSESKRAFRTALFFDLQINKSKHLTTIDLSPAIDMQYKALELLFRDHLEDISYKLISHGILQRKLDVIGYARPIPQAMDEFENYLSSLSIIESIPFFSRFKLRKMLRAICQFKRGRRFTLDGLKAFGLFLLCFGRKKCRYKLENLFILQSFTDEQLFEFCKALHIFQDFRNRAAHEGFHPSKSNNLNEIWQETAKIVEGLYKINPMVTLQFMDGMEPSRTLDQQKPRKYQKIS